VTEAFGDDFDGHASFDDRDAGPSGDALEGLGDGMRVDGLPAAVGEHPPGGVVDAGGLFSEWRKAKTAKDRCAHGVFAATEAMIGVAQAGGDPDDLTAIRAGDFRTPDDYLEIAESLAAPADRTTPSTGRGAASMPSPTATLRHLGSESSSPAQLRARHDTGLRAGSASSMGPSFRQSWDQGFRQ